MSGTRPHKTWEHVIMEDLCVKGIVQSRDLPLHDDDDDDWYTFPSIRTYI